MIHSLARKAEEGKKYEGHGNTHPTGHFNPTVGEVPDLSWVLVHARDIGVDVPPAGPGLRSLANSVDHREEVDWNRTDHMNSRESYETDIAAIGKVGVKR